MNFTFPWCNCEFSNEEKRNRFNFKCIVCDYINDPCHYMCCDCENNKNLSIMQFDPDEELAKELAFWSEEE